MKGEPLTSRSVQLRAAGLALIGVALLAIDGASPSPLHTLVWPLVMAVGAMLAIQNVLAVALATLALAGIRINLAHPDWVPSVAYPALTAISGIYIVVELTRRFRQKIAQTREARRARRE